MNQSIPTSSDASGHHTPLSHLVFQSLAKKSPARMRFDDFMGLALYHNQHGYYRSSFGRKIGREGDFYTSVSVGDTFGRLLGHAMEAKWQAEQPLKIVEQGAHNGQLAMDIIQSLIERQSPLLQGLKYYLVEPSEQKRSDLEANLDQTLLGGAPNTVGSASEGEKEPKFEVFKIVGSLDEIRETSGIYLSNELLDAFAVRRFCRRNNNWFELFVVPGKQESELETEWFPVEQFDSSWENFLSLAEPYYRDWPDGYETEFCQGLGDWVKDCSQIFSENGQWWLIDYGFTAENYFAKHRHTGTLKCYSNHRTHEAPTWRPGECDISAHVNYTHLLNEAEANGLTLDQFEDQSQFLTHAARDWLLSLEGEVPGKTDAARLKQFQTLTHPSMMGRAFQVLQLSKKTPG